MSSTRFIDHRTFSVREGRAEALQAWLRDNEQQLAAAFPPGSQYLGLYVEIYGGVGSASWHLLYGAESYATLDVTSAAAASQEAEFGRLIAELLSFFDLSATAPGGSWLYRAASNAVVWEN